MLLHLRVTVPTDRSTAAHDLLAGCPGVAHLAVLPGAALRPAGDLFLVDVAREFGPLAALAVGLVHRRRAMTRRALVTLTAGFAVAIAVIMLIALLGRVLGWFGPELLTQDRPATYFITHPDRWSLVVAVLAGVAGVLSLTSARSGALVGVFISVTTVPAAGAMALGLALGDAREFGEATAQLAVNAAGILGAALVTLALQRAVWRRVPQATPRVQRVGHARS